MLMVCSCVQIDLYRNVLKLHRRALPQARVLESGPVLELLCGLAHSEYSDAQ